ncbi:MAG: hypothetical protein P1U53_13435 [Sulfitobacter sp.]|nr:hypothetical protein [Sulfitobacter sp.]
MTPTDLIYPVVLLLAFIGYVTCLARYPLATLTAGAGLAALIWQSAPLGPQTMVYWGAAAGVTALALALAFIASRSRPPVKAPPKKLPEKLDDASIVIDGTNVLFWDGDPDLRVLRAVVDYLKKKGHAPFVFLDASSRHHLGEGNLNERGFANRLGLPQNRVMVCPAGTEADIFILKFAREQGLPILSNDGFRDRPQQIKGIPLVKGVFAGGRPILDGL